MIPLEEKLNNILVWEIKSKKLEQADRARVRINNDFSILARETRNKRPNPYTAKRLRESINKLREEVHFIKAQTDFANLVKRDIISQLEAQDTYVDYWYPANYPEKDNNGMNIENYIDGIYGKGALALIDKELEKYDYKLNDSRAKLLHKIEISSLMNEYEEIREKIKKILPKLKQMILDYSRKKQLLSERFNFDLILAEPSSETSYWDGINWIMALKDDKINAYRKPGEKKIRFYEADIDLVSFHEWSHALRGYFSRNMPLGLRATEANAYNLVSSVVDEGVCQYSEVLGQEYIKTNKKSLGLSNKDIKLAKLFLKFFYQEKIFDLAHTIYHKKEREDPRFDAHVELARRARNPVFEKDPDILDDEPLSEGRQDDICYFLGRDHVHGIMKNLKETYYSDVIKRNEPLILRGLLTGYWSFETHRDFFFKEYMPKITRLLK